MKHKGTVSVALGLSLGLLLFTAFSSFESWGQTTPSQDPAAMAEELRLLREKVHELEQRLKTFESRIRPEPPQTNTTRQVQELEQKVTAMERERQLEEEAAAARAKTAPKLTVGEQGFAFASADGAFAVQLRGLLQVDTRSFFENAGTPGSDGILLRRARPILQGTLFRDFSFVFAPDFGGNSGPQIADAYLNYKYSDALQLQAGKFKTPVGLELLAADRGTLFNERSLVSDLVPFRDLGIALHGEILNGSVNYAVGMFNGIGDGRNSNNLDTEDTRAFAGRLFFRPFKTTSATVVQGLGFGVGSSYEDMQGTNTAGLPLNNGYATVAQQTFFTYHRNVVADGTHWRLSPQASYYYGPFGLFGEYAISDQEVFALGTSPHSAQLQHQAWHVNASWVLTGEDASYEGVVPRRTFNPARGGWGAWQIALRYSELDVDPDAFPFYSDPVSSARRAQEWSVGLNWFLNRNMRFATSFSHTDFTGGGGNASNPRDSRKGENVLFTRFQLAF